MPSPQCGGRVLWRCLETKESQVSMLQQTLRCAPTRASLFIDVRAIGPAVAGGEAEDLVVTYTAVFLQEVAAITCCFQDQEQEQHQHPPVPPPPTSPTHHRTHTPSLAVMPISTCSWFHLRRVINSALCVGPLQSEMHNSDRFKRTLSWVGLYLWTVF